MCHPVISCHLGGKYDHTLVKTGQKCFLLCSELEYLCIQMVAEVSGNTFKTAASVVQRPSGFFLRIAGYLFLRCLAQWLEYNANTEKTQTRARFDDVSGDTLCSSYIEKELVCGS